jgi:hypothetical protein
VSHAPPTREQLAERAAQLRALPVGPVCSDCGARVKRGSIRCRECWQKVRDAQKAATAARDAARRAAAGPFKRNTMIKCGTCGDEQRSEVLTRRQFWLELKDAGWRWWNKDFRCPECLAGMKNGPQR